MTGGLNNDTMCRKDTVEQKRFLRILEKTSMFQGLMLEQAQRLLGICEIRKYRAGEVLYKEGTPSTEMLMLLSGRLAVRKGGRTVIAEIVPVDIVGEMGCVTGQVRSAQVVVLEDSMGLILRKDRLDILLRLDSDLDRRVSKNIIGILCQKIREDGIRMADYECIVSHLKKQLAARSYKNDGDATAAGSESHLNTPSPFPRRNAASM